MLTHDERILLRNNLLNKQWNGLACRFDPGSSLKENKGVILCDKAWVKEQFRSPSYLYRSSLVWRQSWVVDSPPNSLLWFANLLSLIHEKPSLLSTASVSFSTIPHIVTIMAETTQSNWQGEFTTRMLPAFHNIQVLYHEYAQGYVYDHLIIFGL